MPTILETEEWGEVTALTVREAAKRMAEPVGNVEWYAERDLLQSYMVSDQENGCIKSQKLYIDLEDLAHAEKFARNFPDDAPWDRVLWARYEVRVWRERQQEAADPRATERTMVQPQPQRRPQKPQPPAPQKPSKLPRELRNVDFYDELEAREPSRPPRAEPVRRQSIAPAGRQPQRRQTIEEDYYAEPDEPTVKDTGHYSRQKQPVKERKRGRWW